MKVLVLVHEQLVPAEESGLDFEKVALEPWYAEYHVTQTLKGLGHSVKVVGLGDDLSLLRQSVQDWKPNIVFNLLEEFAGEGSFDHYIVSYLELLGVKYTGCNPRGLMIGRDKGLAKKILKYHRISTPDFLVFRRHQSIRIPTGLEYPLFVKTLNEEASLGISNDSIVNNKKQLKARIEFLFESLNADVLAETYIDGREFYVGVLGNQSLKVLPPRELVFKNAAKGTPIIATRHGKWNETYRKKWGIQTQPANPMPPEIYKQMQSMCKRAYRQLELSGCARMDLRWDPKKGLYLIEANPNPDIGDKEDFAASAAQAGIPYSQLIQKLLNLGLRW